MNKQNPVLLLIHRVSRYEQRHTIEASLGWPPLSHPCLMNLPSIPSIPSIEMENDDADSPSPVGTSQVELAFPHGRRYRIIFLVRHNGWTKVGPLRWIRRTVFPEKSGCILMHKAYMIGKKDKTPLAVFVSKFFINSDSFMEDQIVFRIERRNVRLRSLIINWVAIPHYDWFLDVTSFDDNGQKEAPTLHFHSETWEEEMNTI